MSVDIAATASALPLRAWSILIPARYTDQRALSVTLCSREASKAGIREKWGPVQQCSFQNSERENGVIDGLAEEETESSREKRWELGRRLLTGMCMPWVLDRFRLLSV